MENLWIIIIVALIIRSIVAKSKETGRRSDKLREEMLRARRKHNVPREDPVFNEEGLVLESAPGFEPVENRPHPEWEEGFAGPAVVITKAGRQEIPGGERRPVPGDINTDSFRKYDDSRGGEDLFEDGISRQEFIKGMVWSQILGPRGGIQASRRFRYRY